MLLENKCIVPDLMGLGNENCTFNNISTRPCWYTLECSPPVRPLWKAWCTTAVCYLKQKENLNEKRWIDRCFNKTVLRLTFKTSRTAVEICKQVDSSCHRKAFMQFNGTSIRKVRWCNCSSGNTGNGKFYTTDILRKVDWNSDHSEFRFIISLTFHYNRWHCLKLHISC